MINTLDSQRLCSLENHNLSIYANNSLLASEKILCKCMLLPNVYKMLHGQHEKVT